MTYVWKIVFVVLAFLIMVVIDKLVKRGTFAKAKASVDGTVYRFDQPNYNKYSRWIGALILIAVAFVAGCSSGNSEPAATAPPVSALCPSVIEGTVDAPPIADRVSALAIEAASKGITLTGDYATDVRNQGGEMMLIGTGFKFVFDAGCQIDKSQSRLNLFLTDYPVEGGIAPDGALGMAVDVGGAKVGVKGRVVAGKFTEGEVRKGWLPHIYGVLNGTFTPVAVK